MLWSAMAEPVVSSRDRRGALADAKVVSCILLALEASLPAQPGGGVIASPASCILLALEAKDGVAGGATSCGPPARRILAALCFWKRPLRTSRISSTHSGANSSASLRTSGLRGSGLSARMVVSNSPSLGNAGAGSCGSPPPGDAGVASCTGDRVAARPAAGATDLFDACLAFASAVATIGVAIDEHWAVGSCPVLFARARPGAVWLPTTQAGLLPRRPPLRAARAANNDDRGRMHSGGGCESGDCHEGGAQDGRGRGGEDGVPFTRWGGGRCGSARGESEGTADGSCSGSGDGARRCCLQEVVAEAGRGNLTFAAATPPPAPPGPTAAARAAGLSGRRFLVAATTEPDSGR